MNICFVKSAQPELILLFASGITLKKKRLDLTFVNNLLAIIQKKKAFQNLKINKDLFVSITDCSI